MSRNSVLYALNHLQQLVMLNVLLCLDHPLQLHLSALLLQAKLLDTVLQVSYTLILHLLISFFIFSFLQSNRAVLTQSFPKQLGCPSTYNPSCAYFCGEAQVPFGLCESTDITGQFASCSKCPTAGPSTSTTPISSYTTTTPPPVYTTPSSSSSSSTCSPYSAAACPAVANPCCAYLCGEAQVPFPVCQPTDGTGQFASCSKCPTMGSMTTAPSQPSTYVAPTVSTTPAPAPHPTTVVPAGNGTSGGNTTTYTGVPTPSPTYIAGAASVAGGATVGLVVVMGFVGLLGML